MLQHKTVVVVQNLKKIFAILVEKIENIFSELKMSFKDFIDFGSHNIANSTG